MPAEENKALVTRLYEQIDEGNLDVIDEILATTCVWHYPSGVDVRGPEGYKEYGAPFLTAFPDLKHVIEDMIAEGDKIVARLTMTGTQKGEFMGIAPTGKQVIFTAIAIFRISNSKFVEVWAEIDALGLMQQLDAVPPPGES